MRRLCRLLAGAFTAAEGDVTYFCVYPGCSWSGASYVEYAAHQGVHYG